MSKKRKKKQGFTNPIAVANRLYGSGAGSHGDAKKEADRKACRGKVERED